MTRIAILGGGYGGVKAAKELHKIFKKDQGVEITLFDRNPYHTLMTELHEVAGGRAEPESVQVPFDKIFGGKRVNVVVDTVEKVDLEARTLKTSQSEYVYDYIIMGPGAEPEFFSVKGAQENSFTLWSFDDAVKIRRRIEDQFLKASREADAEKRKAMLTFTVAGAGFTGIEMLGELLEWRPELCKHYGIDPQDTRILLVEAMTDILPLLPKNLREKTLKYIGKMGGEVYLNKPITEVGPQGFTVSGGTTFDCETLIWTCGVRGNRFASDLDTSKGRLSQEENVSEDDRNLRFNIKKKGRLLTNEFMQSLEYPSAFIVGDVVWFVEEHHALPQIVETALQTADTAAHNIAALIKGQELKAFKSDYHGFMVSVGGKYAVANVMGLVLSGFMAMAMKHIVNLHYLFDVAGVNACWDYMKHHFLQMPHKRSIIGGHASAKVPAYWLLPARLWLGLMWVMEGVNKIGEGWLKFDRSRSFWMFSSGVSQNGMPGYGGDGAEAVTAATTEAWDAATAATGTTAEAVSAATDTVGSAAQQAVDTATAASDAGWDAATTAVEGTTEALGKVWDLTQTILPWDNFLVTWFRVIFMDNMAAHLPFSLFQISIVFVEIAIGLALMGGFLTFPAAVASIGLCFVFILSGMFAWNQLWFIFMAIAMLGGAGKVAGLDYWVMPWAKSVWNGTKLAQRTYLYIDRPTKKKGSKDK